MKTNNGQDELIEDLERELGTGNSKVKDWESNSRYLGATFKCCIHR